MAKLLTTKNISFNVNSLIEFGLYPVIDSSNFYLILVFSHKTICIELMDDIKGEYLLNSLREFCTNEKNNGNYDLDTGLYF